VKDNSVEVEWIRPYSASYSTNSSKLDKILIAGPVGVSYAYGQTDGLSQHTQTSRGFININLISGDTGTKWTASAIMRLTHGLLMFVAWGFLLLIGAIWARYVKPYPLKFCDVPAWFYVHRFSQYLGTILALLGFILAFIMTKVHYKTLFHGQLGTTVMILSLIQIIGAVLRPPPAPAGQSPPIPRMIFEIQHHWTGRLSLLLAIPVIISGLFEYGATVGYLIGYIGYLTIILITIVVCEILRYRNVRSTYEDLAVTMGLTDDDFEVTDDPSNQRKKSLKNDSSSSTDSK